MKPKYKIIPDLDDRNNIIWKLLILKHFLFIPYYKTKATFNKRVDLEIAINHLNSKWLFQNKRPAITKRTLEEALKNVPEDAEIYISDDVTTFSPLTGVRYDEAINMIISEFEICH